MTWVPTVFNPCNDFVVVVQATGMWYFVIASQLTNVPCSVATGQHRAQEVAKTVERGSPPEIGVQWRGGELE